MGASASATAFWASLHVSAGPRWTATYWASSDQPYRDTIVEGCRLAAPWQTLLELGCHCGPNLRRLRVAFPDARLLGCDVNATAAAEAAARFAGDPGVRVWAEDLVAPDATWPTVEPDVILTAYTLAYVAPDDLPDVAARLVQTARRALVIAEPQGGWFAPTGACPTPYPEWRHDYVGTLRHAALAAGRRTATAFALPIRPPADRLDGVYVLRFADA